ncbi:MAG: hypothetical protein ACI89J_002313 [Hyphomicrobiaceae bacterium]|jgi:hypothetical protein
MAGALALLATPARAGERQKIERSIIAATTRNRDGSYAAVLYDLDKGLLDAANLPARGHDVAINPITRGCVAFARRPGTFAISFGVQKERPPIVFHTPANRHFYGHGIFSPDGRLLYTTENDFENGQGIIGVWDVMAGYKRIGELLAHGIGPHDINLLGDGQTLVIANGGIVTHPDHGRRPLNLATMSPSLTYIDCATGDLLEQQKLPGDMQQRSIRHLDVGANGTVIFGCQFKGARSEIVDLVGFHQRGKSVELLSGGPTIHRALRHYVSSVAVDRSGAFCGITSSRGQQLVIVDVAKRQVIATHEFADVSGIAASVRPGSFVVASGDGGLAIADRARILPTGEAPPWSWDNHAIALPT